MTLIQLPVKNEKYIPPGPYCYHFISGPDKKGRLKTLPCPFWDTRDDKPEQSRGYCHYLEKGDWEDGGTFLLWDLCKECGIKSWDDYEIWEDENPIEEIRYRQEIIEWAELVIPLITDQDYKSEVVKWLESEKKDLEAYRKEKNVDDEFAKLATRS